MNLVMIVLDCFVNAENIGRLKALLKFFTIIKDLI